MLHNTYFNQLLNRIKTNIDQNVNILPTVMLRGSNRHRRPGQEHVGTEGHGQDPGQRRPEQRARTGDSGDQRRRHHTEEHRRRQPCRQGSRRLV